MSYETLKFALEAALAVAAVLLALRFLARFLSWVERSEIARQQAEAAKARPAPTVKPPEGAPPEHIAAIAAAVAACGYRVVHIADAASGHAWAAEGRWIHQTSHRPH